MGAWSIFRRRVGPPERQAGFPSPFRGAFGGTGCVHISVGAAAGRGAAWPGAKNNLVPRKSCSFMDTNGLKAHFSRKFMCVGYSASKEGARGFTVLLLAGHNSGHYKLLAYFSTTLASS